MPEDRGGELLHVVGNHVVTPVEQRGRSCGLEERHAGARAGSQCQRRGLARGAHDRRDVGGDAGLDAHGIDRPSQLLEAGGVDHRRDAVRVGAVGLEPFDVPRQDPLLHFRRRIADLHFGHEAIELGLRQGVGALELDRVLCGEHGKRL